VSLEFTIEYPCQLRERYTEAQLRLWARLGSLHARLTTGDMTAPSEEKLHFIERSREQIDLMQKETSVCRTCPAGISTSSYGESVGCTGRITYPIEAHFEKFLADRVQLVLDTMAKDEQPRLLRILVESDTPFDGEGAKELRRVTTEDGLRFFELRLPIKLVRQGGKLTTDNIFDLLLGFTSSDPERTSYSRELPTAALADYYEFLDLLLRSDLRAGEIERLEERGKNYGQFLRLLTAMDKADALNSRILID
jgi:hypothetical protein